jgi:hypothetical protein
MPSSSEGIFCLVLQNGVTLLQFQVNISSVFTTVCKVIIQTFLSVEILI